MSLFYFSNDLLFCARDVSRLRMQRYCFFLYHQIIFNLFFKKFLKNLLYTSFSIYYKTNFFTPKLNFLSTYTPNRNFNSPSDSYFISKKLRIASLFFDYCHLAYRHCHKKGTKGIYVYTLYNMYEEKQTRLRPGGDIALFSVRLNNLFKRKIVIFVGSCGERRYIRHCH